MTPTWQSDCGLVQLYLGDCREVLPHLPKVDAVVTDPPYGIGKRLVKGGGRGGWKKQTESAADVWDIRPDKIVFDKLLSISKHQIIWGGNFFDLPPTQKPLCWDKVRPNQKNAGEWEFAWTSLIGRAQMIKHCGNGGFIISEEKEHPTQKPDRVMIWCLSFLPDAKTILDPFMGSGTTGIACLRTGRKFIGIEISEKYFNIAKERIQRELSQLKLPL